MRFYKKKLVPLCQAPIYQSCVGRKNEPPIRVLSCLALKPDLVSYHIQYTVEYSLKNLLWLSVIKMSIDGFESRTFELTLSDVWIQGPNSMVSKTIYWKGFLNFYSSDEIFLIFLQKE